MLKRLAKTMKDLKITDTSESKDNYEQLKSKIITLKNNELLCAATGKPCPKDDLLKEINKEIDSASTEKKQDKNSRLHQETNTQTPHEKTSSNEKSDE